MSEVILRVKVPLKHLISSPYDTENVSKRKIYGTFEKRIFRVPYIVRNWLFFRMINDFLVFINHFLLFVNVNSCSLYKWPWLKQRFL